MGGFNSGYYNPNVGYGSQITLSDARKNIDCGPTQDNTTTESNSDTQIPEFSTQQGIEKIITSDPIEENDGKRIPWSVEDDKVLASAWLTISNCSVAGNSQSETKFWNRITTYYNEHRTSKCQRKEKAVKLHWRWISRMMIKNGRRLILYNVLQKKIRTNESGAYISSSNMDTSLDIDDCEVEIRPIGQKLAKKTKRKAKGKSKNLEEDVDGGLEEIKIMLQQQKEGKFQRMERIAES
ncbi:uncharacterized protein LOC126656858 [Mercurialis annua]|uniref:uncharacterized protein LOC126656858 n=1 Tax=Mercurialis annua TaxID=3986 RepID=UPI00215F2309|nr:uncharacterized protein LOC126656858 [Mercurialis annua]